MNRDTSLFGALLLAGLAGLAAGCDGVAGTADLGPPPVADGSFDFGPVPDALTGSDLGPGDDRRPGQDPSSPDQGPPVDGGPPPDGSAPTCLPATGVCTGDAECCEGLSCGMTSLGQVCCGNQGAPCATENGEDCCGDLLCIDGQCTPPGGACLQATETCQSSEQCCDGRSCATTSLGQVCCGNDGDSCTTANGEDCCGALLCQGGRCTTGGSSGGGVRFRAVHADAALSGIYASAYFDHGGQDWSCGSVRYGGHQGNDFACKNGQGCIDQGLDVVAAAAGEVIAKADGAFDRCTDASCSPPNGNFVRLRHADGSTSWYLHMKKFSITVNVGDTVTCGQKIGQVASSGQSTGAHTHFHFNASEAGAPADPFGGPCSQAQSRWVNQQNHGSGSPGAGNDQLPAPTCQ